jgi:hypothetical protein
VSGPKPLDESSVTPLSLARAVIRVIEDEDGVCFVTGSIASSFYGEPRHTRDVDVVADISYRHIFALMDAFPSPEYYISRDAAIDALQNARMFNIIHPASGSKVDLIVSDRSAFNQTRFTRVVRAPLDGGELPLSSPEDVILKKLEFYKSGGSERHIRDIMPMLASTEFPVDRSYIERWAERLDLAAQWAEVLRVERLG